MLFSDGRNDVMIYGFDADVNNVKEMLRIFYRLFKKIMHLNVTYDEIVSVTKIGGDSRWRRPVIMKLRTYEFKQQILNRRKKLAGIPYKFETYLPREVMLAQKALLPQFQKFRKMKKHVVLRDGKLIINGRCVRDLIKEYNERNMELLNSTIVPDYSTEDNRTET